jgi:hypothetical protein
MRRKKFGFKLWRNILSITFQVSSSAESVEIFESIPELVEADPG